jgi:hypothetical protein
VSFVIVDLGGPASGKFWRFAELSRFIDFEQRRRTQATPATHWWWYLDVLARLPQPFFISGPSKNFDDGDDVSAMPIQRQG